MAEIGKAGSGNKPDISGADHRDTHKGNPIQLLSGVTLDAFPLVQGH
jgi:hypothetical protein